MCILMPFIKPLYGALRASISWQVADDCWIYLPIVLDQILPNFMPYLIPAADFILPTLLLSHLS